MGREFMRPIKYTNCRIFTNQSTPAITLYSYYRRTGTNSLYTRRLSIPQMRTKYYVMSRLRHKYRSWKVHTRRSSLLRACNKRIKHHRLSIKLTPRDKTRSDVIDAFENCDRPTSTTTKRYDYTAI